MKTTKRKHFPRFPYLQPMLQHLRGDCNTDDVVEKAERRIKTAEEFIYFSVEVGLWKRRYLDFEEEAKRKTFPLIITPQSFAFLKGVLQHVCQKFVTFLGTNEATQGLTSEASRSGASPSEASSAQGLTNEVQFVAELGYVSRVHVITYKSIIPKPEEFDPSPGKVVKYVFPLLRRSDYLGSTAVDLNTTAHTHLVHNCLYLYVPASSTEVDKEWQDVLAFVPSTPPRAHPKIPRDPAKDINTLRYDDVKVHRREVWSLDVEHLLLQLQPAVALTTEHQRALVLLLHTILVDMFQFGS